MSIWHSQELLRILPVVLECLTEVFGQGWVVWLENTDITTQQGSSSGAHVHSFSSSQLSQQVPDTEGLCSQLCAAATYPCRL